MTRGRGRASHAPRRRAQPTPQPAATGARVVRRDVKPANVPLPSDPIDGTWGVRVVLDDCPDECD